MKVTIRPFALLPLLLLPLACGDSSQSRTGSNDGVHAADRTPGDRNTSGDRNTGGLNTGDRSFGDRASDAMGGATSAGAGSVADGLAELQPRVDAAIAKLQGPDAQSNPTTQNNLSQLSNYQRELPNLIQRLRNSSGAELNTALENGRAMLNEIPRMLSNMGV